MNTHTHTDTHTQTQCNFIYIDIYVILNVDNCEMYTLHGNFMECIQSFTHLIVDGTNTIRDGIL